MLAEDRIDPLVKRSRHLPSFFPTVPVLSRAAPIVVNPDQAAPVDIVLELRPTTTISGTVSESLQHFPIVGVTARLYLEGELTREAITDGNGAYDFGGVAAGTYTLAFLDEKAAERPVKKPFQAVWYAGTDHPEGSPLAVPLVLGDKSIGADIVLTR